MESRRYAITAQQAYDLIDKMPQSIKTQRKEARRLAAAVGSIAGDERLYLIQTGENVALAAVKPGSSGNTERMLEERMNAKLALMYVEKKKIPWE